MSQIPARPRLLFLVATGRSGSLFLHSLFDSHPQILGYPAIASIYTGVTRAGFSGAGDAVDFITRLTPIRRHLLGLYDEVHGRFGADGDSVFRLDGERFLPLLRDELERAQRGNAISRPRATIAIHRAFARYQGRDPDRARLILDHLHHPSALAAALADFPDASCINTIRDPRPAYYSKAKNLRKEQGYFNSRNFYLYSKNSFLSGWRIARGTEWLPRERYRVVRLEDLHRRGPDLMAELADWLGIDDDPSLHESTLAGVPWGGNSSVLNVVKGFSRQVTSDRWKKDLSWVDILRIEHLLRHRMGALGYQPITEDSVKNRLLGPLTLLAPLSGEFRWQPRALRKVARRDDAYYPLTALVRDFLAQRGPGPGRLAKIIDLLEAGDPDSRRGRRVRRILIEALVSKRALVDPWLYYLRRVALFVQYSRSQ